MAMRNARAARTLDHAPKTFSDHEYWRPFIGTEELVWAGRPAADFQLSAMGNAIGMFFGGLLLLAIPLLIGAGAPPAAIILIFGVVGLIGLVLVLGPARLNQTNRARRRYALTKTRAFAVRDVEHERPRQLRIGPRTRLLEFGDDNAPLQEHHITDRSFGHINLAFVNRPVGGSPQESLTFERLNATLIREIRTTLNLKGVQI
ncbi:MAG: hypothetical protein AB8B85_19455 [Paracoccaceae bacterium]